MLRIAGGSVNQTPLDWKNNTHHIIQAIEAARKKNVSILCLPELCITGYGCEDLFLSDWVYEKSIEQLAYIAQYCEDITVALGLPIQVEGMRYSSAALIHKKKIQGIVCKQHLANDGVHYEPRWFSAWQPNTTKHITIGTDSIPVGDLTFDLHGITIGFEICEDGWRGDERPGHRLKKRGVNLILNPSASHFAMGKSLIRENKIVLEAATAFQCAYVFANLIGNESGRIIYDGDILIAHGDQLLMRDHRLTFHRFKIAMVDIDFLNPNLQNQLFESNKDRNEELTKATSLGLYDYLRKSKAKGFVLSLSGGADSGMCAILVAEMVKRASQELGWETFCEDLQLDPHRINGDIRIAVSTLLSCAYQSTRNSSPETLEAAQSLASSIGADFHEWSIDEEVNSYTLKMEKAINRKLAWETDDISLQNIQARARSPIIWYLANIKGAILLTTSNRSEGDVGYATMDGDTSGSLAPIAGLSKVFILNWLRWAEHKLGHSGLKNINQATPTAELRPPDQHQADEKDLMPYPILEKIERLAIVDRKNPLEVYEALKDHPDPLLKVYIAKFFRLWCANQWKRERMAPSFHLDDMNVDPRTWCRFPIISSGFREELEQLDLS